MRRLKPSKYGSVKYISMGSSSTSLRLVIPRKATLAQVGETVVSRCFAGCLGQARNRCSNSCCCGLRNYASDARPTDALAAGVECPKSDPSSRSCCVLHCYYCRAKIYRYSRVKKYQPSDPGGPSLVRRVQCLTF